MNRVHGETPEQLAAAMSQAAVEEKLERGLEEAEERRQDLEQRMTSLEVMRDQLEAMITRLDGHVQADIARLRHALKPFAAIADLPGMENWQGDLPRSVTLEECRAAKRALEATSGT